MSFMNHILCCINDAYAQHCGVLLASLFENNRDLKFHVHIFSFCLNKASKENLSSVATSYHQTLSIQVIDKPDFELPNLDGHYISAETYIRLFVPQYIDSSIDKILYLDVDMVVVESVKELLAVDLKDNLVGAIMDSPMQGRNNRLEIPEKYGYFNAGLLLINLRKWREENFTEKCIDYICNNASLIVQHDHDVLNALAYDQWLRIPFKWNMLNTFFLFPPRINVELANEVKECKKDVRIAHFTGTVKPWTAWTRHPYGGLYYKYIKHTPWRGYRPSLSVQWKAYRFPKNLLAILGISNIVNLLIEHIRK